MSLRHIIPVLAYLCTALHLQAQPHPYWQPIDTGFNSSLVGDLQYSENFEMLICSGGHGYTAPNGEIIGFLGGFDGQNWHVLTEDISSSLRTLVDYDEGILFGGGTPELGGVNIPHMAYFDGENWSFPYEFNGNIAKLKWVNDTLYALGWFTEIDGNEAYRVAALVDGVWEGRLSPDIAEYIPGWQIIDIEYYNGEIYLSGNFQVLPNEQSGNPDGPNVIAFGKLSNGWIVKPTEEFYFLNGLGVANMVVYQDELYLSSGNPVAGPGADHSIHKFDGTALSPIPHPPRRWHEEYNFMGLGGVVSLVANGDYLYVGGQFSHMGEYTHTGKVARWDGSRWCGLFATEFDDLFRDMAFINEQLVIINPYAYSYEYPASYDSYWIYTGGDEVSECSEPLSTKENEPKTASSLYPNPAETFTTISSVIHHIDYLALFDLQSRLLHEAQPRDLNYRLPLEGLPAGMYVVQVQVGNELGRVKLVVE